uniref:NACHT domain-containing protein n=1 Tax=Latimeria chalumnae TaxID=7897 RepID=H3AKZ9_LATCH
LFRRSYENNKFPETIVVSGVPGIGKTTLVQKILHDWITGKHHQRFAFVFLFKFRDLNQFPELTSLAEIIVKHHPCLNDLHGLREILSKPENLLFILDGLDESKTSIDFKSKRLCSNPERFNNVCTIVTSLVKKSLMKGCTVLITSRPTALEVVNVEMFDRCTEIIGFLDEQRKTYFKNFFCDGKASVEAFEYVQQNDILYTMCFNPSYCWILCSVLKSYFTKAEEKRHAPPKTITQLFVYFVNNILTNHRREAKNPQERLQNISKMAQFGVCNKVLVFYDTDMESFGIQPSQFLSGFMKEILQKEESFSRLVYTFLHLTLQEFLAALSLFLDPKANVDELLQKADTYTDGRLEILFRFLSGLCNPNSLIKDSKILGSFSPETTQKLIDWLKAKTKKVIEQGNKTDLLNTFHCLYETQNKGLIRETVGKKNVLKFSNLALNPVDCYVLSYVLSCCEVIETLELTCSPIEQESFRKLKAGLNKCKVIRLRQCSISAACCKYLSPVLSTSQLLTELDLRGNFLGDVGVKLLSTGLKDRNCRLEKLGLRKCGITAGCCRELSYIISAKTPLTELHLRYNKIGDLGVQLLSAGLRDQNCTLQKLDLYKCDLTAGCCKDLSSILTTSPSLTELYLAWNKLGDLGMKLLCIGLKHPNCKLQKLE